MKQRPWILVVLAAFHFLAPIGNFFLSAWVSGVPPMLYIHRVMTLGYWERNWAFMLAPVVAGAAIYACKKWSLYVYFAAITVLFVYSFLGYQSRAGVMGLGPLFFIYVTNIAVVVYFLIPAVRNVYFDRKMRWWEIRPRYFCDYKAQWKFEDDVIWHDGTVGNISENGLFLKSDILPREEDMIELTIPFDQAGNQTFQGKVIFHKNARKIGFGVEFVHTPQSQATAKGVTQYLEQKGQQMPRVELLPEDSFTFWVRTLLTTGRGFVPGVKKS